MQSLLEKKIMAKIKGKYKASKIFLQLLTKIMKKKTIILLIILNFLRHKTSYSLGNLHIDNYMFEDWKYRKTNNPIVYTLHLVSAQVSGKSSQGIQGLS